MTRTTRTHWPLATLVILLFALGGCSKDSPTQPGAGTATQADADDATALVGMSLARGLVGDPSTAGAPASGLAAPAGLATDTTLATPFVTWTLSRTFYNALGLVQPTYDPITTVRMNASARGVGAIRTLTDTVSFGSAAALEVRGLSVLQDTLVGNGTRQDTLLASLYSPLHSVRVHHYVEGSETRTNVRHLKPVSLNPWPLSGTATWTLKVDRLRTSDRTSVERHFTCTVVVVFNGSRNVAVTVDGTYHYTLDLLDGRIVRT